MTDKRPLLTLGRLVATPGAMGGGHAATRDQAARPLGAQRHGDCGDLSDADKLENERSVRERFRILSACGVQDDPDRLWVITETDRSATTILRPDE